MDGTTHFTSDFREVGPGLWFPFRFGDESLGRKDEYRVREVRLDEPIDASEFVLTFPVGTQVEGEWWWHVGEQVALPLTLFVVALLSFSGLMSLVRAARAHRRRVEG